MIRSVRLFIIPVIFFIFLSSGCKDKLIPATSEPSSHASSEKDPFVPEKPTTEAKEEPTSALPSVEVKEESKLVPPPIPPAKVKEEPQAAPVSVPPTLPTETKNESKPPQTAKDPFLTVAAEKETASQEEGPPSVTSFSSIPSDSDETSDKTEEPKPELPVISPPIKVEDTESAPTSITETPEPKSVESQPPSVNPALENTTISAEVAKPVKGSATLQVAAQTVVEKNKDPLGELFVDWPKPKLLLVFTGFMNGYVEPCGCAGMDQMKGGLSRRHTFFKALEKKNWSVLPIDAGNLNKGFGNQEELKFSIVIDNAYRMMKYGAVGIGDRELLFPTEVLILYSVDSPGNKQRYTSANVAILEFNPEFTVPYRVFEEGGMKVGVMSVVAPSLLKNVNNQDIVHKDPIAMIKSLLPQFVEEKCDKRVLLVHGTTPEIEKIVKALPGQFDFVVPGDTPAEPPFRPRWIGDSLMIDVGEKGKFAVAVGVYDDPDKPFRYERVPLDARFENSEAVVALMQFYQDQLKEIGLEGLGIKPIPDRRAGESGKFVGSKACADCHEPSYSVWRKSKHASAWRSLVETSKPARTHDPECVACHVVGWNPTEFLPYENGFLGEKETPHLLDVGCESCHGPGEMHVKAEQGSDEALQEKLRKAVRLPLEGNVARKNCITCHDGDNSPHFDFDTYWPKIVHDESEE